MLIFSTFIIYNFIKGFIYSNPYYSGIGNAFITFFLVLILSFIANSRLDDLRKYLNIFAWSFLILGLLHSLFFLSGKFGYITRFWIGESAMVMPLVFYYFLFNYLLENDKEFKYLIYSFFSILPILLNFEKAIIVPFVLSGFLLVIINFINYIKNKNIHYKNITKIIKRGLILFLIFILILLIYYIILPDDFETYRRAIFINYLKISPDDLSPVGRIDGGRYFIWKSGLDLLLNKPLLGYGFGVAILSDLGDYVFPHNIIIDILLSFGIMGLLFFGLIIGLIIKYMNFSFINKDYQIENKTILAYSLFFLSFSTIGVIWNKDIVIYSMSLFLGMLLKIRYINSNTNL